jgi:hypothetical protein
MNMGRDLDYSLSLDPRRSTNIDGLPSPVTTPHNSQGVHAPLPMPVQASNSLNTQSTSPNAMHDLQPGPLQQRQDAYNREGGSLKSATPGTFQTADGSSSPPSPDPRPSQSSPPNLDTQRVLSDSPTSYANGNVNEYTEGIRLFPPSPASSVPRPQTLNDAQQQDPEPEFEPEPARDRTWYSGEREPQPSDYRKQPRNEERRSQREPDSSARLRDDAQWPDQWRVRDEPTLRGSAQVRVSGSARAQQPTVVAPPPPQQSQVEEVCIECAMRDQDMADVDVTSPGIWTTKSDVAYEELLQRELAEEAAGIVSNDPKRPRARGGRLTESNLRLWLTLVRFFFGFCLLTPCDADTGIKIESKRANVKAGQFGNVRSLSTGAG